MNYLFIQTQDILKSNGTDFESSQVLTDEPKI